MKIALLKDIFREITSSLTRFFSIGLMIALGVFVYTGLKGAAPMMLRAVNDFTAETQMADIKLQSNLGLSAQDRQLILAEPGVDSAEWLYSLDLNTRYTDLLLEVQSLPRKLSLPHLTAGRLPEAPNEILLDADISGRPYQIGDMVWFKKESGKLDMETDKSDALERYRFKVVGFCYHPEFTAPKQKGDASGGLGKLEGFAFILEENFTAEKYSFGRLRLSGVKGLTSDDKRYKAICAAKKEDLENLLATRPRTQLRELKQKARDKIAEGEEKLRDAQQRLDDAERDLDEADGRIQFGERELSAAKDALAEETAGAIRRFAAAEEKLKQAFQELTAAQKQYQQEKENYLSSRRQYEAGLYQWQQAGQELAERKRSLMAGQEQIEIGLSRIRAGFAQLAQAEEELKKKLRAFGQNPEWLLLQIQAARKAPDGERRLARMGEAAVAYAEILRQQEELTARQSRLTEQQKELNEAAGRLSQGEAELKEKEKDLQAVQSQLAEGEAALAAAQEKLERGQADYAEGQAELSANRQLFAAEQAAAQKKLTAAAWELAVARGQYEQGKTEFADKKAEAEEDIADGRKKIDDAKKVLKKLKDSPYAVLTREDLSEYFLYYDSARRIYLLSNVFPVFFFLIALLVCLSTMTRMADEHRGQIGTLKALGYGNWDISKKYFYYGFWASLMGGAIGAATGQPILTKVVYRAYKAIFVIQTPPPVYFAAYAAQSIVIGIVCTAVAAYAVVNGYLRQNATTLMRPKAPKSGTKIFLERLTFLWRRLSFLYKVTARNMFRYKIRMSMTILGIAGCAGLVFLGFALRDSVGNLLPVQYGQLTKYDYMVIFDEDFGENGLDDFHAVLEEKTLFESHTPVYVEAVKWKGGSSSVQTIYLVVPEKVEEFYLLQRLQNPKNPERALTLPEEGGLLTDKLAFLAGKKAGDELALKDADNKEFTTAISGICENYLGHYLYMSRMAYQKQFGKMPAANAELVKKAAEPALTGDALTSKLLDQDVVLSVTEIGRSSSMQALDSLDVVVVIIILVSSVLAFVVLYNLTNINISERIRELSTIKVLGFFPQELTAYVYRETLFLTVLGIGLGYVFGVLLHEMILVFIVPDTIQLYPKRFAMTYVISALMTFLFSVIVMFFVHFRLKKIDMVEALKSYE